jgi:hypothetical protein
MILNKIINGRVNIIKLLEEVTNRDTRGSFD